MDMDMDMDFPMFITTLARRLKESTIHEGEWNLMDPWGERVLDGPGEIPDSYSSFATEEEQDICFDEDERNRILLENELFMLKCSEPTKFNSVIGYRVPLSNEEELDIWRKFQKLHKKKVVKEPRRFNVREDRMVIDRDQPIIPLLEKFSVEAFNEICVKAGVSEGAVHNIDIFEVKYIRFPEFYVFYITLDTENGVYQPKVAIYPDDTKTLVGFGRPDRKTVKAVKAVKKKAKEAAGGVEISKQNSTKGKKKAEREAEREKLREKLHILAELRGVGRVSHIPLAKEAAVRGKQEVNRYCLIWTKVIEVFATFFNNIWNGDTVPTAEKEGTEAVNATGKKKAKKAVDKATGKKESVEVVLNGKQHAQKSAVRGKSFASVLKKKSIKSTMIRTLEMEIYVAEREMKAKYPTKSRKLKLKVPEGGYGLHGDYEGYVYTNPLKELRSFSY